MAYYDPTFDVNFAYGDNPVSKYGFTFTRATAATYVNSAGLIATAASGELRYTYDPVTLSALGVLIEEARTNLTATSTGGSIGGGVTVATGQSGAPDGSSTVVTTTGDGAASTHYTWNGAGTATISAAAQYCMSLHVRPGTAARVQLMSASASWGTSYANFSLVGAGSVLANGATSAGIQQLANGWYRIWIVATSAGAGSINVGSCLINADAAARLPSFSGSDSAMSYSTWGAQIEAGAFPTSYIPTTGTAATRNADVLSLTGAADAIFPGYNASAGTIVIDAIVPPTAATYNSLLSINSGSNANQIYVYANQTPYLYLELRTASTTVASPKFNTALTVGNQIRAALAYAENDAAVYVGGAAGQTDNTCPLPTGVTSMIIGSGYSLGRWNGTISRIRYYNSRIPDDDLLLLSNGVDLSTPLKGGRARKRLVYIVKQDDDLDSLIESLSQESVRDYL